MEAYLQISEFVTIVSHTTERSRFIGRSVGCLHNSSSPFKETPLYIEINSIFWQGHCLCMYPFSIRPYSIEYIQTRTYKTKNIDIPDIPDRLLCNTNFLRKLFANLEKTKFSFFVGCEKTKKQTRKRLMFLSVVTC